MKINVLSDNTSQHNVFELGKKNLLVVVGYADCCHSQFSDYDPDGDKRRTTEDYVLNDSNARYDSPERWHKYRFRRICTLPFKVAYRWQGSDRVFYRKPALWIRVKRIKDE